MLAFIGATGWVHTLPALPAYSSLFGLAAACMVAHGALYAVGGRGRQLALLCWPVWAALLGCLLTVWRADARLQQTLAPTDINEVSRVVLRVASLPVEHSGSVRFDADVISALPQDLPPRIRVRWRSGPWSGPYARAAPQTTPSLVRPGQVWRMALVMRPAYGSRNPGGYDAEAHAFAQGIRAQGTVRGEPELLDDDPWVSLSVLAQRSRHHIREAVRPHIENHTYGPVLLALAIGDQAGVDNAHWLTFNRTGITHLVSISGTHVTLIAGLVGTLMFWAWRRVRVGRHGLAERLPAQLVAACTALLIAWIYCLLAGWGVPARRTFLMLSVLATCHVLRLHLGASRQLSLVAFIVVLMDPWALISVGFWLSFGAVAVLIAWGQAVGVSAQDPHTKPAGRRITVLLQGLRLQLIMTVALFPPLALLFNEISLVSPVVNAYAIPAISLLVTPFSLLGALLAVVPGMDWPTQWALGAAHGVLVWMMAPTQWLAETAWASVTVAAAPVWLHILALTGLVIALLPRGFPGQIWGWTFMLPALSWTPEKPPPGAWDMVALDVGQAGAIVIQTANHAILFDTGVRTGPQQDSAQQTVLPFLRHQGVRRLSAVIVSHADIDHVGGLRSVLNSLPVAQAYTPFDLPEWLRHESRLLGPEAADVTLPATWTLCAAGVRWSVDGVDFEFLWPQAGHGTPVFAGSRERNDNSCVLSIRGLHHSLLLPGDINARQERDLIERGLQRHDVVLAAHHGSKQSSAQEFVQVVAPIHAIAQAGAWSRYGHPHPDTVRRWQRAGTRFWRTDRDGAIAIRSRAAGLVVASERKRRRHYWQSNVTD